MKPNAMLAVVIVGLLGVPHIDAVTPENLNTDALRAINNAMTPESRALMAEMMEEADGKQAAVHLSSSDPRWQQCGFHNMNDDDYALVRRMYDRHGREVAFSEDGLIISHVVPKSKYVA